MLSLANDQTFDLTALFSFQVLQDLLRSLSKQQDAQMDLIRGLRSDLETANSNGDDMAKKLKLDIDLKATDKDLDLPEITDLEIAEFELPLDSIAATPRDGCSVGGAAKY